MKALTADEAAALLGWSKSTLIRAADRGEIPCWRTPGGHRRFAADAVADRVRQDMAAVCPDLVEPEAS